MILNILKSMMIAGSRKESVEGVHAFYNAIIIENTDYYDYASL